MAEDNGNEQDQQDQQDQQDGQTDGAKSEGLGDGGKRALEAERKARRQAEKELKELRSKVQEIEDKDKSELERLQERAAAAEKAREQAESKADRFEVAAAKGLSLAQARRLVGSTKEELETDAEEMRTELGLNKDESKDEASNDGEKDQGGDGGGKPREKLRAGASNEDDEEPDAGKLADSILSSGF